MKICSKALGLWTLTVMLFLVASTRGGAQAVDPLIVKMAANEKQMLAKVSKYAPLVETYLQLVGKDGELPITDRYFLHRVSLGKTLNETAYEAPGKHVSRFSEIADSLRFAPLLVHRAPLSFDTGGFIEMLSPDIRGFDPTNYKIDFFRNEFLGSLKTSVFDVTPAKKTGYFRGRLWIDADGHLVRFLGTFSDDRSHSHPRYVHFDSWRVNVKDRDWLPAAIYIEETLPEGTLHGQVRVWGYGLQDYLHGRSSNVTVTVDNAVDHSENGSDVDPVSAMQSWKDLATDNILDKMERAGILAPRGSFDKILDQIVVNLSVPNDLSFSEPVHCRILLTTPIEATTVGNTILLSKGLIETLPSEEAIASVIAFELAHLVKSTAVDTRFSFADRMMFADREVSKQLALGHPAQENERAAVVAVALLNKSMYADKLDNISLYYQQMLTDVGRLRDLYRPGIGDSLVSPAGKPWVLAALAGKGPHLEPANPQQLAALPLGSNLVVDPWSGEVRLSDAPRVLPRSVDEKRPFSVVPVYVRLKGVTTVAAGSQAKEESASNRGANGGSE